MYMKNQNSQLFESDEAMEVRSNDNEETESDYKTVIWDMITTSSNNPLILSCFTIGGEIEDTIGIPAVLVEGVGRVAYPLCKEQTVTLLSVSNQTYPSSEVLNSIDVGTCKAWEIDGHSVHVSQEWLSDSLPVLVRHVCTKLGIDDAANNVTATLDKLLLFEEGGHFKKHCDTEKDPGMFGSLLIQLPAEHEGGHLTVEHDQQKRRFEFDKKSADKSYYSAFYGDCEYTLEPLMRGRCLLLAFNLMCNDAALAHPVPSSQSIDEVLAAATRDWLDDKTGVQKFAVPLAHKYKHTNMTFAGLKKEDRQTLELLQSACDPVTNEKLFSVHLALVTMHSTQPEEPDKYGEDLEKLSFTTEGWVGPAGPVDFGSLAVDFSTEIITAVEGEESDSDESEDSYGICRPHLNRHENIFGGRPDREQIDDDYTRRLLRWHYSAVLVIWPAQCGFDIKLASNFEQAISVLQAARLASSVDCAHKMQQLLAYLATSRAHSWQPARLLSLTQNAEQVETMLGLCRKIKLSTADVAAIVEEVCKYGWTELGEDFNKLLVAQSPASMVVLLTLLQQQLNLESSDLAAWHELLEILVTKIVQPIEVTTITSTHSSFGRSYPAKTYTPTPEQTAKQKEEWLAVSRFVVEHCTVQDQERVGVHLGSVITLHTLNYLITQIKEGVFQARLRDTAVRLCVEKTQSTDDLTAVVLDVVQGGHTRLMETLQPTLLQLCNYPALFRAVFALPVVLMELKTDSELSQLLEKLLQARIFVLKPHTTAPPFSWRMSANQFYSNDSRVKPFLLSDQQSISLVGFNGVKRARGWMHGHFGYGLKSKNGINAEQIGTGPRATVLLTKSKSVHEGEVQRCAENAAELQSLRQLLTSRGRDVDGADPVTSATTTNKLISIEARERQREEELPALKRARVEPEIIVIDDD